MASTQQEPQLTFFLLAGLLLGLGTHCIAAWSYEGADGPSHWKETYPECGGSRQSPININPITVQLTTSSRPSWLNYNLLPDKVQLRNNGHTIQVSAIRNNTNDGKNPQLLIDGKTYELEQTHFHWGKNDFEGSEHTINKMRFPLEMHSVHWRVVNGTQVDPPEVIVTTILFELARQKNLGLERFLHNVSAVKFAENVTTIPPFPMDTLIPPFDSNFFLYQGSLTTPPCSEVVTFYIRETLAPVTPSQMRFFRILLNDKNEEMSGNYRPLQARNQRAILYVKP